MQFKQVVDEALKQWPGDEDLTSLDEWQKEQIQKSSAEQHIRVLVEFANSCFDEAGVALPLVVTTTRAALRDVPIDVFVPREQVKGGNTMEKLGDSIFSFVKDGTLTWDLGAGALATVAMHVCSENKTRYSNMETALRAMIAMNDARELYMSHIPAPVLKLAEDPDLEFFKTLKAEKVNFEKAFSKMHVPASELDEYFGTCEGCFTAYVNDVEATLWSSLVDSWQAKVIGCGSYLTLPGFKIRVRLARLNF